MSKYVHLSLGYSPIHKEGRQVTLGKLVDEGALITISCQPKPCPSPHSLMLITEARGLTLYVDILSLDRGRFSRKSESCPVCLQARQEC